jgi:hypothetical protein
MSDRILFHQMKYNVLVSHIANDQRILVRVHILNILHIRTRIQSIDINDPIFWVRHLPVIDKITPNESTATSDQQSLCCVWISGE